MPDTALSFLGALAIEMVPGTMAAQPHSETEAAGALAQLIARDLAKLAPSASALDLIVAAALFDPVELLRPRYPVHAELERLLALAPGANGGRVIALGASNGALPVGLNPDPAFANGPMRLLPFVLRGDAGAVSSTGSHLEEVLLDIGMAGADTALLAQSTFAASIEHARYLSVNDLAAMIAMQYDHVGLGAVWPLIETALFAPDQEHWLDAPPEPLLRVSAGEAHIALLDCEAWAQGGFTTLDNDDARLSRAFDRFQMRQRQIAALLEAHGIPVTFDYCPTGADARALLRG